MKKRFEAIFFDRDGTLGGTAAVEYPGTFQLYPTTALCLDFLREKGIKLLAFSNQPGITSGHASLQDFQQELSSFGLTDSFICPHLPHAHCLCRKPLPGLLMQAADCYQLNLADCLVIGDRLTDCFAASAVGSEAALVMTGNGLKQLNQRTTASASPLYQSYAGIPAVLHHYFPDFSLKKDRS